MAEQLAVLQEASAAELEGLTAKLAALEGERTGLKDQVRTCQAARKERRDGVRLAVELPTFTQRFVWSERVLCVNAGLCRCTAAAAASLPFHSCPPRYCAPVMVRG